MKEGKSIGVDGSFYVERECEGGIKDDGQVTGSM